MLAGVVFAVHFPVVNAHSKMSYRGTFPLVDACRAAVWNTTGIYFSVVANNSLLYVCSQKKENEASRTYSVLTKSDIKIDKN